jgi:solute carrier family 66 (lysosomal lysine-arginine transporter), member 1
VQGLSLALFVFAFLGNTFYVASILSSPILWEYPPDNQPISATILSSNPLFTPEPPYNSPRARALLRESLPYLLGSGGTLLFDVVIVTQGIIYGRRERLLGDEEEDEESDEEDEEMGDADGENSDEEADKRTLAVLPPASVGVGAGDDDGSRPGSDART